MDPVGKGLGIGTGRAVRNIGMERFQIDDAWEKNPLDAFFEQVQDMAMAHLDGKTGLRDNILDALSDQLFVRRIRENDPVTELCKKGPPEGEHFVKIENPRYPNLGRILGKRFLSLIGGIEYLLPLGKEIGDFRILRALDHIVFFTATSIEERFLPFHAHFSDEAEVRAPFALERRVLIAALAQIKSFEARTLPRPLFLGQDGYSDRSGHIMVFRNDDLFVREPFQTRRPPPG